MPTEQELLASGMPFADWPAVTSAPTLPASSAATSILPTGFADLVDYLVSISGMPIEQAFLLASDLYANTGEETGQPSSPAQDIAANPAGVGVPGGASQVGGGLGSAEPGTATTPEGWGTTTPEQRSMLGLVSLGPRAMGWAGRIASMIGTPTALAAAGPLSMVGGLTAPLGLTMAIDWVARQLGIPGYEASRLAGTLSPSEIQDLSDVQGAYAAGQAASERQQAIDAINQTAGLIGAGYRGTPGGPDPFEGWVSPVSAAELSGVQPAGWGPEGPTSPSVSNPDIDTTGMGQFGMGGPGSNIGTSTSGGTTSSSGMDASASGADGSYWGRGGVKEFTQPTRITAGEAGNELGIFIPRSMETPGIQPNEAAVRQALAGSLLRLLFSDTDIARYRGR